MRDIHYHRDHQLGIEGARACVKVIEQELYDRFTVTLDWNGDAASVIGRGVTGTVRIAERDVWVHLRVAFLFLPLVGAIRRDIVAAFERAFSAAT